MRKIEQQMIAAIKATTDWKSENSGCSHLRQCAFPVCYLHGNKIAEVDDDFLKLFDGGWQSTTTKSRLNALLSEFGDAAELTEVIFQKQL